MNAQYCSAEADKRIVVNGSSPDEIEVMNQKFTHLDLNANITKTFLPSAHVQSLIVTRNSMILSDLSTLTQDDTISYVDDEKMSPINSSFKDQDLVCIEKITNYHDLSSVHTATDNVNDFLNSSNQNNGCSKIVSVSHKDHTKNVCFNTNANSFPENAKIDFPLFADITSDFPFENFDVNSNISSSSNNFANHIKSSSINTYSHSNLPTSESKILKNKDVPLDSLKRSFTRLKQTSELLNTEKIYISSLKILKNTYLDKFMSITTTPIYFEHFRNILEKLIENHETLYKKVNEVYLNWYNDSKVILENTDSIINDFDSPNFDRFNYVSNEKEYLQSITKVIINYSIDDEAYSTYCSLYNRILSFSISKGIESLKSDSSISNDEKVPSEKLEADYFVSTHLDTRFISVVQMPTTRMTRYKLILKSLLKNIQLDEKNQSQLDFYDKALEIVNTKIDQVDKFVGDNQLKLNRINELKILLNSKLENNNKNSYKSVGLGETFFENLSNLKIASSFGLVYISHTNKIPINYDYVCGFLFETHLLLATCSNLNNSLDIKLIIPLISIRNNFEDVENSLDSSYKEKLNLKFEDRFNNYEICFLFPNEKEKLVWTGHLKLALDTSTDLVVIKNGSTKATRERSFWYSELQKNALSNEMKSELLKFRYGSYLPTSIKPIKNSTENNSKVFYFEVDHFNSIFESSSLTNTNVISSSPSIRKISRSSSISSFKNEFWDNYQNNSTTISTCTLIETNVSSKGSHSVNKSPSRVHVVKILLNDRIQAQSLIKNIWSNQFEIFTTNSPTNNTMTRSISSLFNSRKQLQASSLLSFQAPSPSFANDSGSLLGSPIKLRGSMSFRSLKDIKRKNDSEISIVSGTSSPCNKKSTPRRSSTINDTPTPQVGRTIGQTPLSTTNVSHDKQVLLGRKFYHDTNQNSSTNLTFTKVEYEGQKRSHITKHSNSLRSLSSFISTRNSKDNEGKDKSTDNHDDNQSVCSSSTTSVLSTGKRKINTHSVRSLWRSFKEKHK